MLVTLHIPPGGSIKQLIGEVTELAGGVRPRTVSGRVGVLVDAGLAYRYLAARHAPPIPEVAPAPPPVVVPEPTPAPVAAEPPAKKSAPAKKAAAKTATPKGE